MKAVVYHADSHFTDGKSVGDIYERLFKRFRSECHKFGIELIHLTLKDFPGWGDENYFYEGNPKEIVSNREECFTEFLETAPEDVYWFTEPDVEIIKMWPLLKADCSMLYREGDDVPMCPAWRLARPQALPFFKRLREVMRSDPRKDWHGDSASFTKVWEEMGRPTKGTVKFLGVSVEFRNYREYVKPDATYSRYWAGKSKLRLLEG